MSRHKVKAVLRASGITDFRPGLDAVAMINGKAHVVSLDETYAPVAVDEPPAEVFRANAEQLTEEQRTRMLAVVLKTPLLTPEGRAARVRCLVELGARITFEVARPPRLRVSLTEHRCSVPRPLLRSVDGT